MLTTRGRSGLDAKVHLWLLAEARWDEAFTPPAFRQVLLWAIGVVPWTVLTQFIGPVMDESKRLQPRLLPILRFFWNILVSTFLALVASVVLQAVALAILLLSIIPLDPVRDVVSKLQRFASSSVGDLYMVLTSPIQRAALTSAVQRDIDWMRRQGCKRVALVAHSQGGYVAYQALTDAWYRPVDAFVTFGSGLIRLTESERARRSGVLLWALIGVVGALIALRFAPIAIPSTFAQSPANQASTFTFAVGLVMFTGLIVAMLAYRRDFQPSEGLEAPQAILAVSVICAKTDEEAARLASSMQLSWVRLRSGRPTKIPSPETALSYPYSEQEAAVAQAYRQLQIVGTPSAVTGQLPALLAS